MSKYWFDTDPGIDDALAILMALLEKGEAIAGFSTVHGNHPERVSALNLARLLTEFSARGFTPANWQPELIRGAALPLKNNLLSSEGIHGKDGLGDVTWQAGRPWLDWLEAKPRSLFGATTGLGPLTLVCLAPLTNLALTLQASPTFLKRVENIIIMGGSIRAGGNASMAAEYNFLADPQAAHQVLNAGFKNVWLVPLDAANACRFKLEHLQQLEKIPTQAAKTVRELLSGWEGRIRQRGQGLYDLVAWLLVTHSEWGEWEEVFVDVDIAGGLAYGASLADWRNRSGNPPNVKVAMSVKSDLIWKYFLERLANGN